MSIVPEYAAEADLKNPLEHIAWALSSWPGVEDSQPYPPAPRPLLPFHSKHLYDLGFRYHPKKATIRKVVGPKGVPIFVGVDDPDPVVDAEVAAQMPQDVMGLLAEVDPNLAANIGSMSEDERKQALRDQRQAFEDAVEVLRKLSGD